MANNRAARLRKLAELARSKERMAGFEIRRLKRALQEQDEQLERLNDYRSEYSKRFTKGGESGLDVAQLQNYHLFFRGLNDAIDQQGLTVGSHHAHVEEGEVRWRQEYRKANTLDKAIVRIKKAQRSEAEKIEQRITEETISSRRLRNPTE